MTNRPESTDHTAPNQAEPPTGNRQQPQQQQQPQQPQEDIEQPTEAMVLTSMRDLREYDVETQVHRSEDDEEKEDGRMCCGIIRCSTIGRILLFLCSLLAIGCSVYTGLSCTFFEIRSPPEEGVANFPEGTATIGLFSYSIDPDATTASPEEEDGRRSLFIPEEYVPDFSVCVPYEELFWQSDFSPFFWTAQIASLAAPGLGVLAMFFRFVETIRGRFFGSFLSPIVFYIVACVVQGYTFVIYGETEFCFGDNPYGCRLKDGYFAVAAMVLYYLSSVLICFLPRPVPCFRRRRSKRVGGSSSSGGSHQSATVDSRDQATHPQSLRSIGGGGGGPSIMNNAPPNDVTSVGAGTTGSALRSILTDEDGIFEDEETDTDSQHRRRLLLQQIQQARKRYMVGYPDHDAEAASTAAA